jgi:hypothetical protein
MKASELRLGNLVNFGVKVVPIKSIHTESVLKDEVRVYVELNEKLQHYCLDIIEIEPTPLTEEWLLKFGFVKHKTTDIYPTFAKQMFNWNDGILYIIGYGFMNHIKYVHQLQNLYFALTGEELVVKE